MKKEPFINGAFEAKTKLGKLLEWVGQGKSFVITKHDRPVARLMGYDDEKSARRAEAVRSMRALRESYRLGGVSVREIREEVGLEFCFGLLGGDSQCGNRWVVG